MYQQRSGINRVSGWCQTDVSVSASVSEDQEERHIVETAVLRPPGTSCCIFMHQKGRPRHCGAARSGIHPKPTLSTHLHDSNPCLVNCTVAHLLHAVSTFVACALRHKARSMSSQSPCSLFLETLQFSSHYFDIFG